MKVKLWNRLDWPYKKVVDGETYEWAARGDPDGKDFIELPRSTARKIIQTSMPMQKDGPDKDRGFEQLYLEEDHEALAEKYGQPLKFASADGKKFRTRKGLEQYERSMSGGVKPKRRAG